MDDESRCVILADSDRGRLQSKVNRGEDSGTEKPYFRGATTQTVKSLRIITEGLKRDHCHRRDAVGTGLSCEQNTERHNSRQDTYSHNDISTEHWSGQNYNYIGRQEGHGRKQRLRDGEGGDR